MSYTTYTVRADGDATFEVVETVTYTDRNGVTYEWDEVAPGPAPLVTRRLERTDPDTLCFILTDETAT